ncbi:hypothetical protein EVAR_96180_1 [Eumeta japonica]|uniref:Uncharacterized protein n=1 Tax=Eumeta variegata TaxID=151549 RepID=A0A4C1VHI6_EUMVA|nr:hypothetical protein EVAR_96180_1 [Eumeta japonica]
MTSNTFYTTNSDINQSTSVACMSAPRPTVECPHAPARARRGYLLLLLAASRSGKSKQHNKLAGGVHTSAANERRLRRIESGPVRAGAAS